MEQVQIDLRKLHPSVDGNGMTKQFEELTEAAIDLQNRIEKFRLASFGK